MTLDPTIPAWIFDHVPLLILVVWAIMLAPLARTWAADTRADEDSHDTRD